MHRIADLGVSFYLTLMYYTNQKYTINAQHYTNIITFNNYSYYIKGHPQNPLVARTRAWHMHNNNKH